MNSGLTLLTDVFHSFLLEEKLHQALEQIIMQKFYFSERDEIDSILQFAASIFEGKKNASKSLCLLMKNIGLRKGYTPILTENGTLFPSIHLQPSA